jgi:hypothetical protein
MRHIALPLLAAILTSCATPVVGPYAASVSEDDIRQIHELVAARSDMPKRILSIRATQKDCVYVETTRPIGTGVEVSFTACKRHGNWQINERSVMGWRSIITASCKPMDLTNRCSQPLAVLIFSFQMTSTLNSAAKLAPASGG